MEKGIPMEIMLQDKETFQERRKEDRRKTIRRAADRNQMQFQNEKIRKLESLLELGWIIGLDLQLNGILLKIALKAVEVMDADRCSFFLYDGKTNELWSNVALGMGEQVIRIPSGVGIAGYCFKTGETVNIRDAYGDPRFNKEIDTKSGYHTRSLLCMPLCNRAGERLGVIQLLNKKEGVFTGEDETFLKTFGNHASVFLEMAQLQKARIDALEQSRAELERLNRAKGKALDHLSHELRTPLAVIQGYLKILKRKLQDLSPPFEGSRFFKALEKHLNRIMDIQQETDKMIRSAQETDGGVLTLFPIVLQVLDRTRKKASHRVLQFSLEGSRVASITMSQTVLEDMLEGLLKNAVENTPDGGLIRILLDRKNGKVLLKVQDFGIGITEENQKFIFDGLFHTQETDLYESKRPHDFYAGGKGLDLHRMKAYGRRFGFDLSVESRRCLHLPTDRDLCPGKISDCLHCTKIEDCLSSGGSTFTVVFSEKT
jgi:signal transduction histidine kinase